MDAPLLLLAGVTKRYGRLTALDDVTISSSRSEFVVLLGPNGAGKTTLLQLLTGLFVPDGGTIAVMGYDMRRNPTAALARLGVVFQQPTLDPELSVTANLFLHCDLHGIGRSVARRRVADALERFGLQDSAARPARVLSGGNRRRVELARALLHQPQVLLMDEATVGLDPQSRRDLMRRIVGLKAERGLPVVWATHLVDEAQFADRLVFLDSGRIVFDGSPGSAMERAGADTIEAAFFAMTRRPAIKAEAAAPV